MIALGLDIGTTTIALTALDLDTERVVSVTSVPNSRLADPAEYAYLQDAEAIAAAVDRLLATQGQDVVSLGIAGQMHGLLYLDGGGRPASPLYTWLDRRAVVPVDGKIPIKELELRMGRSLPAGYALATHYALRMAGRVPADARRITGICEYLAERLVGARLDATDASYLASYGAYDSAAGRFDAELLRELLGPRGPAFLSPAPPLSVAGLWKGRVPVAYPVGDNQAGFYGLVSEPERSCLVNLGTSGQLSLFVPDPPRASGMELRPFLGKGFLLVGAILCGGKAYELVQRFLREAARLVAGTEVDVELVYAAMERAARESASTPVGLTEPRPLRVITAFDGTRRDPELRGSILDIGLDNFSPAKLVRGLLWGVVDELRAFAVDLGGGFGKMTEIVATGGFARRSEALIHELADAFGLPVSRVEAEDGAGIGAALIGAAAAGLIDAAARSRLVASLPKRVALPRAGAGR